MLDSRASAQGGDDYGGGQVSGGKSGEFGRSSPMERRPATAGAGGRSDLDDDIPF